MEGMDEMSLESLQKRLMHTPSTSQEYNNAPYNFAARSKDYHNIPHNFSARSKAYGNMPLSYAALYKDYDNLPQNYAAGSKDYDITPQNYASKSKDYDSVPLHNAPFSKDYEISPQNYAAKSKDCDISPQNYVAKSKDYGSVPQNYVVTSKDFSNIPQSKAELSKDYDITSQNYASKFKDYETLQLSNAVKSRDFAIVPKNYAAKSNNYDSVSQSNAGFSKDCDILPENFAAPSQSIDNIPQTVSDSFKEEKKNTEDMENVKSIEDQVKDLLGSAEKSEGVEASASSTKNVKSIEDQVKDILGSGEKSEGAEASTTNTENDKSIEDQVKDILGNTNKDEEDKITDRERDRARDLERVRELKKYGCGCAMKCDEKFTEELILNYIQDIREMERAHRDMIIMNCISEIGDTLETKKGKKRQRMIYSYTLEGKRVCRPIFMLVFNIGRKRLGNLKHHYEEYGVTPRIHGNLGRRPGNALNTDDVKYALQFLLNFVDEYGLPQPGASGPNDKLPPTFLPSDCTRKHIHDKYTACCGVANMPVVKYSSFGNIWRNVTPHLKVCNNKEEVCVTCDALKKAIRESPTDEIRHESEEELRQHIMLAQKVGELYGACLEEARDTYREDGYEKYIHYTFGFCQHLNLPHRSSQMGPVYFTALRKVRMFGFRIDGIPKQLNFLIDENETIGVDGEEANGPNAVISMIDWALDRYGGDERKCAFHGDNCLDHKRLWYLVAYFMWRVMTGRQDQIELMLQVPGHVHSLVESSFSSIKQMYRTSDCETVEQLDSLIMSASTINEAIRYPSWRWADWEGFLTPVFKELRGTRNYHYFRFAAADPGYVTVRTGNDEESRVNILHKEDYKFDTKMPVELKPGGLSHDRMTYLYKRVRPFVHPSFQDRICPEPPSQDTND